MNSTFPGKVQVAWISGMPRSGTTWLSQIFASAPDVRLKFCPLFSYEFKNALDEQSSAEDWEKLFEEVYRTNSEFLDQEYLRKQNLLPRFSDKKETPRHLFIKSTRFHNLIPYILRLQGQIRFVHIVRHPCATIHSWLNNPNEFPEGADPMDEWRTGKCRKIGPGEFWGFDDWKLVTTQALQLRETYPDRFQIIRYEDLVQDTKGCTKELFKYFDLEYGNQTNSFIEHSHSKHDENLRSVFKIPKLSKQWQKMLDESIINECLEELMDTELQVFMDSQEL